MTIYSILYVLNIFAAASWADLSLPLWVGTTVKSTSKFVSMWLWAKYHLPVVFSPSSHITDRVASNMEKPWTNVSVWLKHQPRKDVDLMKQ